MLWLRNDIFSIDRRYNTYIEICKQVAGSLLTQGGINNIFNNTNCKTFYILNKFK